MAKVKRSVLKQLIKECLVEILIEGIDSEPGVEALVEAARPRPSAENNTHYNNDVESPKKQRSLLDSRKVSDKPLVGENIIASMTDDSTMADIFRDTAQTTLMEQGMQNKPGQRLHATNHSKEATAVAESNPDDLFSGSQNWASLAFANNNNNDK